MVVEGIQAVLGFIAEPAQGHAPLAAVARIVVSGTAQHDTLGAAGGSHGAQGAGQSRGIALHMVVAGTTILQHVDGEEGTAVVEYRLVPLQLVEGLGRQPVGQTLSHIEHIDRDQAFLDLGTWAAECGHINRVDGIDTILNKGTFAPANDLFAQAY